ncbi:MAG: sporulation protein YqfD, partial [Bacilli bacterium]|nr:sporulation protein YqfD [Bacilli bacterium]
IYLISNVIISVDIKHENKKLIEEVNVLLKEKGIRKFTLNKELGILNNISDEIVHDHRDFLDWLSINKQGMKYIVSFEERIMTTKEEKHPYCHIVAKKDGVIKQIKATSGVNLLEEADYVKKGDIIISGQIMLNDKIKDNICAEGEVIAETWYKTTIKVPLIEEKKDYTNKKRYNFSFNNNNLFKSKYINYDAKTIFKIGPFKFIKELETAINTKELTKEEAEKKGISLAKERLLDKIGKNNTITSEKVLNSELNNSTIILEVFFSVDEVISSTKYFEASDEIDTE